MAEFWAFNAEFDPAPDQTLSLSAALVGYRPFLAPIVKCPYGPLPGFFQVAITCEVE